MSRSCGLTSHAAAAGGRSGPTRPATISTTTDTAARRRRDWRFAMITPLARRERAASTRTTHDPQHVPVAARCLSARTHFSVFLAECFRQSLSFPPPAIEGRNARPGRFSRSASSLAGPPERVVGAGRMIHAAGGGIRPATATALPATERGRDGCGDALRASQDARGGPVSSGGLVQPGQQLGLLEGLADDELKALEQAVREVRLPAGATVFEEGDPGDALYLVRSGLVDVVGRGPAGAARVVTIGPGETIGEQSLLSGRPRSASAVAQTGVTLWRLDHADFVELLASSPRLGSNVGRIVSERLSAASRARVGLPKGQTVVLCAATSRPIALVAAALTRECRQLLGEAP